jgi:signal transduction histidine kinase
VQLAETGECYDVEFYHEHNGLEGWYREIGVRLEGDIILTTEDITERKQKEEKLRRSEALLLESQEIAQLGTFQWNKDMTESIWTPQLFKLYGIEPYSVKVNLDFIATIIHPEDKDRFFKAYSQINADYGSYSMEYRIFTTDGRLRHMWARWKVVNNRLTGTVMDITERKELELKNAKLALRNDELDHFVYTASHDLRSPMNNIEMLTDLLSNDCNNPDNVELYVELLSKSITQLKNTLQDLTTVTEIHQAQKDLVNLDELIEEVKVALFKEIEESAAVITTQLDIPSVEIPKKHARSLLFNLLSNALKFRAPDRTLLIHMASGMHNGRIRLRLQDNGIGIREEDQAKVFMIFKRLNHQITGRGIGMYLVKRIIDLNNGTIQLESQENVGTTFHIEFPITK